MDNQLSENIKSQTKRLLDQLKELEDLKQELDQEEFEEMRKDTLEQLEKFEKGLEDIQNNNLSLNDEVKQAKIELQKALKGAFNTEGLKQNLKTGQAVGIRDQIKNTERDFNLGKLSENQYVSAKLNYINNLVDLQQELSQEEKQFLETKTGQHSFEQNKDSQETGQKLVGQAGQQIKKL